MVAKISLSLLLAGIASAADQNVISFAFPGDGYYTIVPTAGVSGSILNIENSRTTMVYQCAKEAETLDDYSSSIGVLCPMSTNLPQTVTFGDGFYGQSTKTDLETITVDLNLQCEVTATPASNGAAVATASPTCTMDFGDTDDAEDAVAVLECAGEDVIGTDTANINTASLVACFTSATATPTNVFTTTYDPSNVWYWTVTVTGTAEGVTVSPTSTGTAAQSTSTGTSGAAGNAVSRLSVAGVVGLAAAVLAL
ncbi:hypothetical protein UCRNP2_674 [Neofusicoccum parvum UCRNP2]|uniref:Gpi anchored protein n=1 Tax=Botryosphaeria parva (strain UCR-NP2) TaxID=1287680 RepID=R1GLH8_BOTPV|nr:hypothetical protein UCRNP2_674 [Neofusicoccum parvum UCRNP2]